MAASAQSGHSIVDQPATPATCTADREAAQARRENPKGLHAEDQRGRLGTAQQHTHRR